MKPCPVCSKLLADDEVYRSGYEATNNRTIPPTIGRGSYCDHIPRDAAVTTGENVAAELFRFAMKQLD